MNIPDYENYSKLSQEEKDALADSWLIDSANDLAIASSLTAYLEKFNLLDRDTEMCVGPSVEHHARRCELLGIPNTYVPL